MKKYLTVFILILMSSFCVFCEENYQKKTVERARDTIFAVLKENNQWQLYQSYVNYVSGILDKTSGNQWWNDKNGYFRLTTIDRWLRNPVDCMVEGENITAEIHRISKDGRENIGKLLTQCANLLDIQIEMKQPTLKLTIESIEKILLDAEKHVINAFSNFSSEKLNEFIEITERLLVRETGDIIAHSLSDKQTGLALCSMADRVKMDEMFSGALVLSQIFQSNEFDKLKKIKPGKYGKILVGTNKNDTYNIENLKGISCIIEPGGNDTYIGGKTGPDRPVFIIIDFEGNDHYISSDGFAQGTGFFGISILYDENGNDLYDGKDACQAVALIGIGILIDNSGNDTYIADRRGQGSAVCGAGILIDKKGDDRYFVNLFGQGYGGMQGIGILEDADGNDHYKAGGKYDEPYQEPPHYYKHAWSQGCGSGFRGISNGGFGMILDGAGDDLYEADYFSTGGYWFAAGLSRDFGGNDTRRPLTNDFSRYGFGYACHYAIGLLFDDTGNDTYIGTLGIQGFGWDIGTAAVVDFAGNDTYTATISGQGFACQGSWAMLIDGDGTDIYTGVNKSRGQGMPGPLEYHPKNLIGGNFSFLIDFGKGNDEFSSQTIQNPINNKSTENGAGYLIKIE